jgi:hypothetical protein
MVASGLVAVMNGTMIDQGSCGQKREAAAGTEQGRKEGARALVDVTDGRTPWVG